MSHYPLQLIHIFLHFLDELIHSLVLRLCLAFPSLCEFLLVGVGRVPHGLDRLVVNIQTKHHTSEEHGETRGDGEGS